MPSIINTNISSLTAQRQLSVSQTSLATAMARLSSGLRVNSAKDDAAGLAISERFTSQIRGSNQAARNANDGISLAQTAEGDLAQISNNLQRIRELAVQAANGTNSSSDRVSLNNEAAALVVENDRLATTSAFNGIKLLDGTFTEQIFQVGANGTASDVVAVSSIASARANSLGVGASSSYASTVTGISASTGSYLAAGALAINGQSVGAAPSDGVSSSYAKTSGIAVAAAINAISGATNVNAIVNTTSSPGLAVTSTAALLAGAVTVNGVDIGALGATTSFAGRGVQVAAAINAKISQTGVTATVNTTTGAVTLSATDGRNIIVSGTTGATAAVGLGTGTVTYGTGAAGAALTTTAATTTGTIFINGVDIGAVRAGTSVTDKGDALAAAINAFSERTGVTATNAAGAITLTGAVFSNSATDNTLTGTTAAQTATGLQVTGGTAITLTGTSTNVSRSTVTLSSAASAGIAVAGVAANALSASGLSEGVTTATTTAGAGVSSINLTTAAGAQAALAAVDSAINTVNSTRAALGAYQARFVSVVASLATTAENLTASRSRVQDADFAAETAALSRAQILQQAGTAMVAQANQLPQGVMALLRQ